jgi:hypothetical protein
MKCELCEQHKEPSDTYRCYYGESLTTLNNVRRPDRYTIVSEYETRYQTHGFKEMAICGDCISRLGKRGLFRVILFLLFVAIFNVFFWSIRGAADVFWAIILVGGRVVCGLLLFAFVVALVVGIVQLFESKAELGDSLVVASFCKKRSTPTFSALTMTPWDNRQHKQFCWTRKEAKGHGIQWPS